MLFEGKVALVTGSGRGIGRAIALRLAQEGAHQAINFFRNRSAAEETAQEIREQGVRAETVRANIGEMKGIDTLFTRILDTFGGLDILVCNAASGYNRPVLEQRPKGWEWTMNINARSVLFCAQRAAPIMRSRGGGSIVNISSPGSRRVLPDYVVVGASKAAVESITRYLAVELAPLNIIVNAISPGVVRTAALEHFAAIREGDQIFEKTARVTPAGRLVHPEDVASLVAFLCSPAAEMIRGQVITIDGGLSLPMRSLIHLYGEDGADT